MSGKQAWITDKIKILELNKETLEKTSRLLERPMNIYLNWDIEFIDLQIGLLKKMLIIEGENNGN